MKLTFGMPVYDDTWQLRWSLVTARMLHPVLHGAEIIVLDNHPTSDGGKGLSKETGRLKRLVEGLGGRYIPMSEPTGTAPPRNRIFEEATGDVVVVTDSHVAIEEGGFDRILDYFSDPAHALDIVQGPRLGAKSQQNGRLTVDATHYGNVFRAGMQGIWANAFGCPCGKWNFDIRPDMSRSMSSGLTIQDGSIIASPAQEPPTCMFHDMTMERPVVHACPECGKELPIKLKYQQHWDALTELGYVRRCWEPDDTEPFDIPGLGLGMFAARKDAWPGFPAEMRGFGGGELNLHETFRRNGGRAVCLPGAGWWHSFHRTEGKVTYEVGLWNKVRNYVLWARRLNNSLDDVHRHFVLDKVPKNTISQANWEHLIKDPVKHNKWPGELANKSKGQCCKDKSQCCKNGADGSQCEDKGCSEDPLESIYQSQLNRKCDIEHHLPTIRKLAEQCESVVAITKRQAWDIGVLAGKPKRHVHYCSKKPGRLTKTLEPLATDMEYKFVTCDVDAVKPVSCNLLILDAKHTAEHVKPILDAWGPHVSRWIVKSSAYAYAQRGENKEAGLDSVIDSWMKENHEWHRVFFDPAQRGLVVLSCDPAERDIDQLPGTILHGLFTLIGVEMAEGCGCRRRIAQMNAWGVEGCKEHRQEIVDGLKQDQEKYSWGVKFKAAMGSIRSGLAFKLNPFNPLGSMFDEAVHRAEKYEAVFQKQFSRQQ